MKSIEIKIDKLGRTVIPIKFRRALGIEGGDKLLASMDDMFVKISTLEKRCALCKAKLIAEEKIELCPHCISKVCAIAEENQIK